MRCIKIQDAPPSDTPEEFRRAWVGLVFPLASSHQTTTNTPVIGDGYLVNAKDAFEILALHNAVAAEWWRKRVPLTNQLDLPVRIAFAEHVCKIVEELPSITVPLSAGKISVVDFLTEFGSILLFPPLPYRWAETSFLPHLWAELNKSALTRPIVILFSDIASKQMWKNIKECSEESVCESALEEGHAFLQSMYRLAVECGISLGMQEIDQPLDIFEEMARNGLVEITKTDGKRSVRLTEKGMWLGEQPIKSNQ